MVCYLVEFEFAGQVFDGDRYFVYVCEETIHSGRSAELALLDEEDCILHWLGVREEQYWVLGLSEQRIFGLDGYSDGQGF